MASVRRPRLPGPPGPPSRLPPGPPARRPPEDLSVPPKPSGDLSVPPPIRIPGSTPIVPDRRPSGMPGWLGAATGVAGALGIRALLDYFGQDEGGSPQPSSPDGTPEPPANDRMGRALGNVTNDGLARMPVADSPETDAREDLLSKGYRDYGSGYVAPGGSSGGVPDHWRRKMWLKQQAQRYAGQIAQNPALYGDMVAAYDGGKGSAGSGSAHSRGAVAARSLTDNLDAQKAGQIQLNVQNAAAQQNIGRQMGIPRGMVMAMQDVSRSAASGNKAEAAAKAAMYSQMYPQFGDAATHLSQMHAAESLAEAQKEKAPIDPVKAAATATTQLANMPAGVGRMAAVDQFHRLRLGGDKADPKQVDQAVQSHYQPWIAGMAGRMDKLNADESAEMQAAMQRFANKGGYDAFLRYAGVGDTPQMREHWNRMTGTNANMWEWWRNFTPWND